MARHGVPLLASTSESLAWLILLHKLVLQAVVQSRLHLLITCSYLSTVLAMANVHYHTKSIRHEISIGLRRE